MTDCQGLCLICQCCDGVMEVVESVHAVCEQLCGVTIVDLEEAVGRLQRFAPVTLVQPEQHAPSAVECVFDKSFNCMKLLNRMFFP